MISKWKLGIIGITLIIAGLTVTTAYAAPPFPSLTDIYNKISDTYNYLVNTIKPELDTIDTNIDTISSSLSTLSSRLTSARVSNLERVSAELGSDSSDFFSYEVGTVDIVTASAWNDLARFTVTVSIYQGDNDDLVIVFMSQNGVEWNEVFYLQPGAGNYATQSITVVCTAMKIQAFNVNSAYPGVDPGSTTIVWAISATGEPNIPNLKFTFP